MTKFYYCEGPDACGKTTWLDNHKTERDMFYHNGVYDSPMDAINTYDEQLNCYEQEKLSTFDDFNCYMDRGPIAEMIYGIVMRGTIVPVNAFGKLMARFKMIQELELIIFLPPIEIAMDIWAKRHADEYIKDSKKYVKVYHMYEQLIESDFFGIPIKHYDFTEKRNYEESN